MTFSVASYIVDHLLAKVAKDPVGSITYWDAKSASYLYLDNYGKVRSVTFEQLQGYGQSHFEFMHNIFQKQQTQAFLAGQITIDQFQERLAKAVKDNSIVQLHLARGGANATTFSDYGKLGAMLKKEYQAINQLAISIANGQYSDAQIMNYAGMHLNTAQQAFWIGQTAAMAEAGYDEERRVLTPAEHCDDCAAMAAEGWQRIGYFPPPGSGSVCRQNCKCIMEYRDPTARLFESATKPTEPSAGGGVPSPGRGVEQMGAMQPMDPSSFEYRELERKAYNFMTSAGTGSPFAGDQKDWIVSGLSSRTGVPYAQVNDFIAQWAKTSNDNAYASLEIQKVAARIWNTELSAWQADKLSTLQMQRQILDDRLQAIPRHLRSVFVDSNGDLLPGLEAFSHSEEVTELLLREMYGMTQAEFRKQGITEIIIRRGITFVDEDDVLALEAAKNRAQAIEPLTNAIESWSADATVARNFATWEDHGAVIEARIPVERVIGSARSGFGCLDEMEYVIIGNNPSDRVRVYWTTANPHG